MAKSISDVLDFSVSPDAPSPKATKRRLTMMSALATGWLPWGVQWHPSLTFFPAHQSLGARVPHEFILCCGHVMRQKEAQEFVSAGLLKAGTDRHGGEALVITDAGMTWLDKNWIS